MGPAAKIQSQVNKELIELSKKNNTSAHASKTTCADKEEDDDGDGEGDGGPEEVIEANADEDDSDEGTDVESEEEEPMNAQGDEGEEEEEGGEDPDDMEGDRTEEYMREEDELEELPTKPAKIGKRGEVTSGKKTPPKKIGRGGKRIELLDEPKLKGRGGKSIELLDEPNDPIAGSGMKAAKMGIPAKKRKVVQFVTDPKADKKRGGKTGKRSV